MVSRLKYLNTNNLISNYKILVDLYKKFEKQTLIIRNKLLKYSIKMDKKIVDDIIKQLRLIEPVY